MGVDRTRANRVLLGGGREQAEALHRDRYLAAESIYISEVDPSARAQVVIDNTDFDAPVLIV